MTYNTMGITAAAGREAQTDHGFARPCSAELHPRNVRRCCCSLGSNTKSTTEGWGVLGSLPRAGGVAGHNIARNLQQPAR